LRVKVLLVYPRCPDTFWSFRHALKFISKRASFPPLGLLTVAAMLPETWEKRLVDINVAALTEADLRWADYVFISAMVVQKESAIDVVRRAKRLGKKVVVGGPLVTTGYNGFEDVDHLVLNEAEATLAPFLEDLEHGRARRVYTSEEWPDIEKTPPPLWNLINLKRYATMSIQYSRGCPFDCEFCDIIGLNGHRPRTKSSAQILGELELLHSLGWRGGVFFVDDNFIGNKKRLKADTLPALTDWMIEKRYPFHFLTEASLNISDDRALMQSMVRAGFKTVFIGIETPHEESLAECGKHQNKNRDLVACVRTIQDAGLEVQGGFIVGFDHDPPSIFERQIRFIQKSGIVTAMVGLLNAPRGTRLYHRLEKEDRLLEDASGDNTDCSLNFVPKMKAETLLNGYRKIVRSIYSPKQYYKRVMTFLKQYKPRPLKKKSSFEFCYYRAFLKSIWVLGIKGKERLYYWKLLSWTLLTRPRFFSLAVSYAIYGFHFRKITETR
jgi:radical SAM superfamily enzyme YgiQ (UPF0313 family)